MSRRVSVFVRGTVQGVGFRPFVYREAVERGLVGWVLNGPTGVQIEVEGEPGELDSFLETLRSSPPAAAVVAGIEVREVPSRTEVAFEIRSSPRGPVRLPLIPADLRLCEECRREIDDPKERRFRYPFTNCTVCGPRYTIVEGLPYDRERTSMRCFEMCDRCRTEYEDPSDRRFHAQPIACPVCGPQLELLRPDGRAIERREDCVPAAARALRNGEIVALKGLGGFQLLTDASNPAAVRRLRERKHRWEKPFALMFPSLRWARQYCRIDQSEQTALESPEAPIVLLDRLEDTARAEYSHSWPAIADEVAPGNPRFGVMLPYTPLHHVLLQATGLPLVCTSGSLSDEPLCTRTEDALLRLGGIADLVLTHDRPVVRPVDDSVVRIDRQEMTVIRGARGLVPAPLSRPTPAPVTLALGAHLKNTIALRVRDRVIPSQHLGDLTTAEAVMQFDRTIEDYLRFYEVEPEILVCDLHPDYVSTQRAEALRSRWGIPLHRVQHHHAHVESCRVEHGFEGEVLGLAWDGTGYGLDGTIWGGEALVSQPASFVRFAHLRSFPLPGEDRVVHEPCRSALGALYEMLGERVGARARSWFDEEKLQGLVRMLVRGKSVPRTTSIGRLFDAVAAVTGVRRRCTFEGQAAMELEYLARRTNLSIESAYPLPLETHGSERVVDWEPLLRAVLQDCERGVAPPVVSARFHLALVEAAVRIARAAELPRVVLTGGCFQNEILLTRTRARLEEEGFRVFTHRLVPPNDGGIAVGQIVSAEGRG